MVKVSIVMPNRNNERWLNKSIGSVLNQTYKNWELIIVDDHSTDNSPEIIREYMDRDDRITGIFDPDRPFPLTRNIGIEVSSGRYILFLDSDDWLTKQTLEEGVNFLKKEDIDAYVSSYKVVRSNGSAVDFIYKSGIYSNIAGLKNRFRFGNGNTLLIHSIIENYDIRFPAYRYSEDSYFYYLYLSLVNKVYVSDLVGFVNNRRGSVVIATGNFKAKFEETNKSYGLLFSRLKKYGKNKELKLIQQYLYPRSIVIYLDITPRRYKIMYMLKYSRVLIPCIFLKRCNKSECLWVYSTIIDSVIPIKWLLRR